MLLTVEITKRSTKTIQLGDSDQILSFLEACKNGNEEGWLSVYINQMVDDVDIRWTVDKD